MVVNCGSYNLPFRVERNIDFPEIVITQENSDGVALPPTLRELQ
jgi:hypothetical protein